MGDQEKWKDKEMAVPKEERRALSSAERKYGMSILKGNAFYRGEEGEIKSGWRNSGTKEEK